MFPTHIAENSIYRVSFAVSRGRAHTRASIMAKSSQPKLFSICTRTNIRVTTATHDNVRKIATTVTVGALDGVLSIGIPGAPPPGGPPVDMMILKNYTNPRGIVGQEAW
jgi:hypothetical protein